MSPYSINLVKGHGHGNQCRGGDDNAKYKLEIEPTFFCKSGQCANHDTTQILLSHAHAYLSMWLLGEGGERQLSWLEHRGM